MSSKELLQKIVMQELPLGTLRKSILKSPGASDRLDSRPKYGGPCTPSLSEHFAVGREIVEFKTSSQIVELIGHYLDHPEAAAEIAKRGQMCAYREHTYEHRLAEILRIAVGYVPEIL